MATPKRFLSTLTSITAEEAGRRAQSLAAERLAVSRNTNMVSAKMDTLLAHAGLETGPNAPMSPPIHMASTYARPAQGPYGERDFVYSRMDNPTRLLLEKEVAQLECHGRQVDTEVVTCAFASGMMAASSIVLAHQAPLTVLLPRDLYHGVTTVMMDVFKRFQVTTRHIDTADSAAIEQELLHCPPPESVIVWMETPSNPLCQVLDISTVCETVKRVRPDATTVVDSTLAPPVLTQPLLHGSDLVMHSGTKSLAGHSDVLLGIVTASPWTEKGRELGPRLRQVQICVGGVASAMDSWLTLRGLRTLSTRVLKQSKTAMELACFLEQHPSVKFVHYPGLESHVNHDVAKQQMKNGYGVVLSVEFETAPMAMAVAGALQTIQRATSLGGTETLIEHRASIEPPERVTSPVGLLRVSVGLEDVADLTNDFNAAIDVANEVLGSH